MNLLKTNCSLSRVASRPLIWFIALLFAAIMPPVSAATNNPSILFATKTLEVRLQPSMDEKSAGRLFVASSFVVLERTPGWLRVALRGWHQEGAERVLYAMPGKRILTLVLGRAAVGQLRSLSTVTNEDTEITWNESRFEGWIRDTAVTSDLDTIWSAAWNLFATRCTVCHQRRIPDMYTANQWGALLKIMGPRTGLPKDDQQLILKYLQNHAKDTANIQTSNKP